MSVEAEFIGDGHFRRRARGLDIAAVDVAFDKDVVAPCFMQQRIGPRRRLAGIDDGGQFLDIEHNPLGDILRLGRRGGEADGDGLADIAHLVRGEDREVRCLEARYPRDRADRFHVREILRGKYVTAGRKLARFYRFQYAVRDRAAQDGGFETAFERDIGDEPAAPRQVPGVFLAQRACTDAVPVFGNSVAHVTAPAFSRLVNRPAFRQ